MSQDASTATTLLPSASVNRRAGHVLLVDDDLAVISAFRSAIEYEGYRCSIFDSASALLADRSFLSAIPTIPTCILSDVKMPGLDGLELLEHLRQLSQSIPTLILSAKGDLNDRLVGFGLGADDYMLKPFYVEELVARVRAILARRAGIVDQSLVIGDLRLDRVSRQAHWQGLNAILSQREFSVLELLMRSPGHIFSRKQILMHVWEINFDPNTNVVDVCIQRIKRKLTRHNQSSAELPIESVRGVGYRMIKGA
jgi:DNA-binding response OmpR family regulator